MDIYPCIHHEPVSYPVAYRIFSRDLTSSPMSLEHLLIRGPVWSQWMRHLATWTISIPNESDIHKTWILFQSQWMGHLATQTPSPPLETGHSYSFSTRLRSLTSLISQIFTLSNSFPASSGKVLTLPVSFYISFHQIFIILYSHLALNNRMHTDPKSFSILAKSYTYQREFLFHPRKSDVYSFSNPSQSDT